MKQTVFALAFLLLSATCRGQEEGFFRNPVIRGDMADPCIIRIGKDYYATGTSSEWAPFFPLYKSSDLINWEMTGHVFKQKPEWTSNSFWAPELFCHDGKVYCYYTARQKSSGTSYIGVATADNIEDGFTDHGPVITFGNEAIDAFVNYVDGELYISWKAYGLDKRPIELLCCKLSDDWLRQDGEPFSLLKDDGHIGMEGQCIFRKGDCYYLMYSTHGCCGPDSDYNVCIARSKDFKGPYEIFSGNPILYGDLGDFRSCGHGTVVTSPEGRMFYLCHGYLGGDGYFSGRQPILHELETTPDGWLRFKTGKVAAIVQKNPFNGTEQKISTVFKDNFNGKTLKNEWSWNFPYSSPDISLKNGKLHLSGEPLGGNIYGTALCVRPADVRYTISTKTISDGDYLKGLTLYGDDRNMVIWGSKGDTLTLLTVKDGKETILFSTGWEGPAVLELDVNAGHVTGIRWSRDGREWMSESLDIDTFGMDRWDRVMRSGLICCGGKGESATFDHFRISYTR